MSDPSKERRPFDTSLQGLSVLYSQHFLSWLRGSEVVWLQALDTVMTAIQRRSDFLIRYRDAAGLEQILHIEFQNQVRAAQQYLEDLPLRMATYAVLGKNRYGQVAQQVLVLIHDSEAARAVPNFYQEGGIRHEFQIIRLWELDPAPIVESGLVGLMPLVPLMQGEMEVLLNKSLAVLVEGVESTEEYGELMGVTALLATLRFKKEWVKEFFRRRETMSLLMETPLFEDLFEERLAAAEQARLLAEQKSAQAEQKISQAEQKISQAEQKISQAEQERDQAEQKAARLTARLRELGIDPDQV